MKRQERSKEIVERGIVVVDGEMIEGDLDREAEVGIEIGGMTMIDLTEEAMIGVALEIGVVMVGMIIEAKIAEMIGGEIEKIMIGIGSKMLIDGAMVLEEISEEMIAIMIKVEAIITTGLILKMIMPTLEVEMIIEGLEIDLTII